MTLAPPRVYDLYPPQPLLVGRLQEELGVSPVLAQILANRGLTVTDEASSHLFGGLDDLLDPERLEGIADAADIVAGAVSAGEKILVHGDYDADGVSATAALVTFLRDVGANVEAYIPHRIDEGYGLSREGIVWAGEQGFQLMISVDCGSSSPQEVTLARSLGLRTVITDHHLVGATIPEADAFVNPRRPGSEYPFPSLSGAGVAYKLIQAVARRLDRGEPRDYLDLVTIGTVGDVVPLVGENRILVREGLAMMSGRPRAGIGALARVAGLINDTPYGGGGLTARDVAFQIAPRINACGRLEHARTACDLLLETDNDKAEALAREIDELNQKRRDIESAQREDAERRVQERGVEGLACIVEASPDWHEGVVGITANRLVDRFNVPALVLSVGQGGIAKGSARGPANLDLFATLSECADLFIRFGGHARAAGFSLREENLDALRERLQEVVARMSTAPQPAMKADVELPLHAADVELAEELEVLAPFGHGNDPPLFLARNVHTQWMQRVKERHLRFVASQGNAQARCIAFGFGDLDSVLNSGEVYDLLFNVELDTWNNEQRVSVKVREILTRDGRPLRAVKPTDAPPSPAEDRSAAGQQASSNGPRRATAPANGRPRDSWEAAVPANRPPHDAAASANGRPRDSWEAAVPASRPPHDAAASANGRPRDSWESASVRPPDSGAAPAGQRPPAPIPHPQQPPALPPMPPAAAREFRDVRTVENRGRYLADLIREGGRVSVVVRRGLSDWVNRMVRGHDAASPGNFRVISYGTADPEIHGADECVLFTPPPSVDALASILRRAAPRCHVLFGAAELDAEETLVRSVVMSRERVETVYRAIRARAPERLVARQVDAVVEGIGRVDVRPETVRVVLRILTEMGVAREAARGVWEWTGARAKLEASPTYQKYERLLASFLEMRRIFESEAGILTGRLAELAGNAQPAPG
ncbi:MAG: single-stranded-DNA-specific exonuclease RecJ [Armatimonadetes bacterium]|nr:single-stranded-DNA-specific exonuclease RecJ [Armatimonadota bacterium]